MKLYSNEKSDSSESYEDNGDSSKYENKRNEEL